VKHSLLFLLASGELSQWYARQFAHALLVLRFRKLQRMLRLLQRSHQRRQVIAIVDLPGMFTEDVC
jgi:hypothetical protein